MSSFREKYGRYSLYVLIAGLGVTIFVEILPFLGGLLGAVLNKRLSSKAVNRIYYAVIGIVIALNIYNIIYNAVSI